MSIEVITVEEPVEFQILAGVLTADLARVGQLFRSRGAALRQRQDGFKLDYDKCTINLPTVKGLLLEQFEKGGRPRW